jgi:hypothetical protein
MRKAIDRALDRLKDRFEDIRGGPHATELIIEAGQMRSMYLVGGKVPAIAVGSVEGSSGVVHENHIEAQIARHARGRGHAMIRCEADDNQVANTSLTEIRFQVGAYKRAVDGLDENGLTLERLCLGLELDARLIDPQR